MARELALSELAIRLTYEYKNTLAGSEEVKHASNFVFNDQLATGVLADQADRWLLSKGRVLTDGNHENVDLYDLGTMDVGAGAGRDTLGLTWSISSIVMLLVTSSAGSTGDVLVGGAGSGNTWNTLFNGDDSSEVVVRPGGAFMAFTPAEPAYAVNNLSNHVLKILASGGDIEYDIAIVARSN